MLAIQIIMYYGLSMENYIKQYLEDRGESGLSFANRTGVSQFVIWNMVNRGHIPKADTLDKIAAAMGIRTGTLLNRLQDGER